MGRRDGARDSRHTTSCHLSAETRRRCTVGAKCRLPRVLMMVSSPCPPSHPLLCSN
ncbi:hypothetical protein PoMZ_03416, partial [Pyricularia oryzae]